MQSTETMIEQTRVMLRMQDEMNSRVDADWRSRDRSWYRAIWIECAELMDHYGGWKWWKHTTPDLPQAVLEIVDIWHFGMSLRLAGNSDEGALADAIVQQWSAASPDAEFLDEVERLALTALAENSFAVDAVHNLLRLCGQDFDDLYRVYVAKNVLNMFRQDHGYKSGEYRKDWLGREDNEVLAELMDDMDSHGSDYRERVYAALEQHYQAVTTAQRV